MQYRKLGTTDIDVSVICLGTMTWGEQNTEEQGHAQMDLALTRGVNFWDVAEMYSVPPKAETYGRTEEIIGTWFAKSKHRKDVVLATKAVGYTANFPYVRDGKPKLDAKNLNQAVEDSLKRLQTDYIDLYQLHWPDRPANYFGQLSYVHQERPDATPIAETLDALEALVKAGKIRHFGLSNETPWGTMRFMHLSETTGKPRAMSVQNPYNLLNRSYEIGLSEVSIREKCGLLAYSPLAMGALSGKYLDGARPAGARLTVYDRFQRYTTPKAEEAIKRYVALADKHNLDPSQMALAFVNSRDFVTSNIIGATTLEQLEKNIASINMTLSDDVLAGIEEIQNDMPNPCP